MEILDAVKEITTLFPDDNDGLQFLKENMIRNANLLSEKVLRGQYGELYDIKMQCASFIRRACLFLLKSERLMSIFIFEDIDYYKIVKDLLEEYRLLFIDWVNGFDK